MSDQDLIAEGRRLLDAASERPWRALPRGWMIATATGGFASGAADAGLAAWAVNNLPVLLDELESARGWARHGYEVGQRSATWSDEGVAPEWLTEGHRPEALDPTAAMRLRMEVDMENVRLKGAMRDVRRILTDLGVADPPPRLAALLHAIEPKEEL